MSIDIEALAVHFLQGQTSVSAIADDRVYTDRPHKPSYPMVVVSRTGGGATYKNHLEEAEVTVTALGTTHKVAYNLANACASTMANLMVGSHPEGVVTKVKVSTVAYEPEPDSTDAQGHARPRYTLGVVVTAHP